MRTPSDLLEKRTQRVRLTVAGTVTTALGAVLIGIGGGVFGLAELTGLGITVILLVVAAAADVLLRRPKVLFDHDVGSARLFVGDTIAVQVHATHHGRGRSPALRVLDPVIHPDGSGSTADLEVSSLAPGETLQTAYPFRASQRGVCSLGPMSICSTDTFGLATRLFPGPEPVRFTVLPAITGISPPQMHHDADSRTATAAAPSGSEFASLREYVPGDDLRRVHWRSSARRDDLVVRREEQPRRPGCTVVLDVREAVHDHESFERAVAAAASIVVAATKDGQPSRLVTTDGFDSGSGSSQGHLDLLLAALAIVSRGSGALAVFSSREDPILTITTSAGAPDLDAAVPVAGLRVVFAGGTTPIPPRRDVVAVGHADRFAPAWDAHLHKHAAERRGTHRKTR